MERDGEEKDKEKIKTTKVDYSNHFLVPFMGKLHHFIKLLPTNIKSQSYQMSVLQHHLETFQEKLHQTC